MVQADGGDVTQGAIADAAVDTDTTGTISGKMRGLVKLVVNWLSRTPAALAAGGGLKIEGVAGGVAAPSSIAAGGVAAGALVSGSVLSGALATGAIFDLPTKAQKNMAGSVPVVVASDQSAVPVKVASGGVAAGAVAAGAVVSGAVLSGALATGAIVDLPTKGQKAMAGSVPVVIASDQTEAFVKVAAGGIEAGAVAAGAVVSGAVLAGAFATGAIVDLPNVGQEAMIGSVPVVIASNQSAVPVTVAAGEIAAGTVAAGAVVSGAILAGAFATGAIVDLPNVGQEAMVGSVPVAVASDQSAVPVSIAAGGVAAGGLAAGSVAAGAVVAGAILTGAIVDLPNVGQEAMDGSVPVVIANNQSAVAVSGAVTVTGTATTTAAASEVHVGKVTGRAFTVPVTVTITGGGVYTVGDCVGGSLAFAGVARVVGGHFKINTLRLVAREALGYTVWLLDAELAAGAIADHAVLTFAAADATKILGSIPIIAGDYDAVPTNLNVATIENVGLQGKCGAATTGIIVYMMADAVTDPATNTVYLILEGEMID